MNPDKLRTALATGTVTEETIDEKCRHIVQTLIAFGFFDREQRDWSIPEKNPVSSETALAVAREAVVLLKNDGDMLPFSRKIRNVVVMGPNATNIPTGGGSGFVMPFETVSVAEGIRNADKRIRMKVLAPELSVDLTARGCFFTPDGKPGLRGEFFANPKLEGNARCHCNRLFLAECSDGGCACYAVLGTLDGNVHSVGYGAGSLSDQR